MHCVFYFDAGAMLCVGYPDILPPALWSREQEGGGGAEKLGGKPDKSREKTTRNIILIYRYRHLKFVGDGISSF